MYMELETRTYTWLSDEILINAHLFEQERWLLH